MLVFKSPLFYLITSPKHENTDAGSLDVLKRSCKVLPLSKKVKVLDFNKERKKIVC